MVGCKSSQQIAPLAVALFCLHAYFNMNNIILQAYKPKLFCNLRYKFTKKIVYIKNLYKNT